MSGSNRRPGSDRIIWLRIFIVLTALCCGPTAAAIGKPASVLRLSAPQDPQWSADLESDRAWLARLPVAWTMPAEADSLAGLRSWLGSSLGDQGSLRQAGGVPGRDGARGVVSSTSLLRDRWIHRGYLAARVELSAGGADAPDTLVIDPGQVFRVGEVRVAGQDFPGRTRILERILPGPGSDFQPRDWDRVANALLQAAGDAGHPFARWVVRDVKVDSDRREVDIDAILFIGAESILGPQTTNLPEGRGEKFLLRAAGLRSGKPFREADLQSARQRLLLRDVYADIGEPGIFTTAAPGTVGVHWPVTVAPNPNRLAVVLGLSRSATGEPSRLSGQVDLLLANLAGTGRRLALAWSDDGRDMSHFGFSWGEPLMLGTPFDADLSLDHEVRSDVYTRFQVDLGLDLPVSGAWGIAVGVGHDRSTYPAGDYSRTSRLRTSAAFRKSRSSRLRSGWKGVFSIETARRQADLRSVDDESAGRTSIERQTLLDMQVSGEMWLGRTLSLAGRGRFQDVAGGGGTVPLSEQYRFGGASSVRGYLEDQFHGERVTWGGVELRLGRAGGSRLYTFYDMGYFRFAAIDPEDPGRLVNRNDTVRGFGLGLETRAAGGDVSLAVGLPGSFDFDAAMLHVSLLQAF